MTNENENFSVQHHYSSDKYAVSIGHLWQFIHQQDFGIVSAFVSPDKIHIPNAIKHDKEKTTQFVLEYNNKQHSLLKAAVRKNYIELGAVWVDKKGTRYEEKSLFINHISFEEIHQFAVDYKQDSFIWGGTELGKLQIIEYETETLDEVRVFVGTQSGLQEAWKAYSKFKRWAFTFVEKESHHWFTRLPFTAREIRASGARRIWGGFVEGYAKFDLK